MTQRAVLALVLPALALAGCNGTDGSEDSAAAAGDVAVSEPVAADETELVSEEAIGEEGIKAPASGPSSAYSDLNLDTCDVIESSDEYEAASWRCEGYAGIPLIVGMGDGRYDVDAGIDNETFGTMGAFNNPGHKVEWRLEGGTPFAIIYRLKDATQEVGGAGGSFLVVETIGSPGKPGCEVARVDGATRDANLRARQLADELARSFSCGSDEPAMVGKRTG